MKMNIEKLYPEKVFYYFSEISKIPRGSKKEKQISDWLVKFAKERKLEVLQDDYNNVLIRKPATVGYEDYSPLIIQGHMDMVWEKNKDTKFDFALRHLNTKIEAKTGLENFFLHRTQYYEINPIYKNLF